jgi:DNA-binding GntR family transcriptional regulator
MSQAIDKPMSAYKTLAAELRADILAGKYRPGEKLPTEFELAEKRGLSRQTVRHAFRELVEECLVYRIRGLGTFTTPTSGGSYVRSFGSIEDLLALSVDTEIEVVEPLELRTSPESAARLQQATDQIMTLRLKRMHHGLVFCSTQVYLPVEIGRKLQGLEPLGTPGGRSSVTIISLLETVGAMVAGAHQSVMAVPAPASIAEWVEVKPGDPVLQIDRLYFDRRGEMVELAVTHFNPDRYSYRVELRRS